MRQSKGNSLINIDSIVLASSEKRKKVNSRGFDYVSYSIVDFVNSFPEIAHVKDSTNFEYQLTNKRNLNVYELSSAHDLIGKTVHDMKKIMEYRWPVGFADSIHEIDRAVVQAKKPITVNPRTFLNKSGFVVVHSMMKIPIFVDTNNEVTGILTLGFDGTNVENVYSLFKLYRHLYKVPHLANMKFLEFVKFQNGDSAQMTSREIECVLSLVRHRSVKTAAAFLEISQKTLETHLCRIKNKTQINNSSELCKVFIANCPCKIL